MKKKSHLFYIRLIKTEEKTNKGFNSFSNDIFLIFRNGGRVMATGENEGTFSLVEQERWSDKEEEEKDRLRDGKEIF